MSTIEVMVDATLAAALQDQTLEGSDIQSLARSLGGVLAPRGYLEADGLPHHWYLEIPCDDPDAVARLLRLRGVEAAYVKPADAPP